MDVLCCGFKLKTIRDFPEEDKEKYFSKLVLAYKAVFETPEGALVLGHLAELSHLWDPAGSPSPEEAFRIEGMRYVVLKMFRMIEENPSKLYEIFQQQEALAERPVI